MDESKKKPIMIGVIVACLAVAGLVMYNSQKGDPMAGLEGETTWIICLNPDCKAVFETSLKDFYKYKEANVDPKTFQTPPYPCEKCGEASGARAAKCDNCGVVFAIGSVAGTFEDTCPECGFSMIDKKRHDTAGRTYEFKKP